MKIEVPAPPTATPTVTTLGQAMACGARARAPSPANSELARGGNASDADRAPIERALQALRTFPPDEQLTIAERRLLGAREDPLAPFAAGDELAPVPCSLDGRLLEAIAARALGGARGAVFTGPAEARLLAALGLARCAARRGLAEGDVLSALLDGERRGEVAAALDGLRVLDPSCGGGALLVAALALARGCGATLRLFGIDVAPLAARAARARLRLLRADAEVRAADALEAAWPAADLVLSNPPFVRHERLAREEKARAARRSGLSWQADLSAHLTAVALRHAPDVALVWPRALDTARSSAPILADAGARGGFAFRVRSRAAGSFAASVDTLLAVWSEGHPGRPPADVTVPLAQLTNGDILSLARGGGGRVKLLRQAPRPGDATKLGHVCEVRFGMKSGCNGFFHLRPLGGGLHASTLGGVVELSSGDVQPILASLREAEAPSLARPERVLFRPAADTATARAYVARGEALGVHHRPSCSWRRRWWLIAQDRTPAPVLYPAKVGARAFAFLNEGGLWEDKKWHALFPSRGLEPWLVAAILSSTPVRLAVDVSARQLTGMQAIADIDCRVLAAAPFPLPAAIARVRSDLERAWAALAKDPVTTDLARMLARSAQEELDLTAGHALGLSAPEVRRARRELARRVADRLAHAAQVREAVALASG